MGELPEVYSMVERVARKQHKCCECKGAIMLNEKYHHHSGVWSGKPDSFKVCPECDALRKQIMKDCDLSPEEAPAFGCVGDECEESGHAEIFAAIQVKRGASPHTATT